MLFEVLEMAIRGIFVLSLKVIEEFFILKEPIDFIKHFAQNRIVYLFNESLYKFILFILENFITIVFHFLINRAHHLFPDLMQLAKLFEASC